MVKVTLQYEIQNNKGQTIKSFWKNIMMSNAPTKDMVFEDNDFTWTPNRSIIYNIIDDDYFVRTVEYSVEDFSAMFKKLGWTEK